MDRTEYEDKMMEILSQDNKLQCSGDMTGTQNLAARKISSSVIVESTES